VQVRTLAAGETIADSVGWTAKRRTRLALVSVGYADGYPRSGGGSGHKLHAVVGGRRCPVAGHPSMDLLPIDVTDLPDPTAARYGELATLIGAQIGVDEIAAATKSSGREVLGSLGGRFHRVYHAM
jgi:alanine racemase